MAKKLKKKRNAEFKDKTSKQVDDFIISYIKSYFELPSESIIKSKFSNVGDKGRAVEYFYSNKSEYEKVLSECLLNEKNNKLGVLKNNFNEGIYKRIDQTLRFPKKFIDIINDLLISKEKIIELYKNDFDSDLKNHYYEMEDFYWEYLKKAREKNINNDLPEDLNNILMESIYNDENINTNDEAEKDYLSNYLNKNKDKYKYDLLKKNGILNKKEENNLKNLNIDEFLLEIKGIGEDEFNSCIKFVNKTKEKLIFFLNNLKNLAHSGNITFYKNFEDYLDLNSFSENDFNSINELIEYINEIFTNKVTNIGKIGSISHSKTISKFNYINNITFYNLFEIYATLKLLDYLTKNGIYKIDITIFDLNKFIKLSKSTREIYFFRSVGSKIKDGNEIDLLIIDKNKYGNNDTFYILDSKLRSKYNQREVNKKFTAQLEKYTNLLNSILENNQNSYKNYILKLIKISNKGKSKILYGNLSEFKKSIMENKDMKFKYFDDEKIGVYEIFTDKNFNISEIIKIYSVFDFVIIYFIKFKNYILNLFLKIKKEY
ncbi:MAG: hypothetical protein PHI37_03740 [Candidatus Gracilibacteria bacterium]|nr:hypothetical protein [Candidatus Gracilibacteria bacterium]